jgi:hypothetical protein
MFMLFNVAIFLTRGASGKLLDLFLVSNPNDEGDHDMIFLSGCFERSRVATLYKSIRSFRDIDRHGLFGADALCTGVQFGLWLE